MEFNKVVRGAKREMNDSETVNAILDSGFLCHVAFNHEGQSMMIPTAYGRKDDFIYLHGSSKNFMLNQVCNGQTVCIAVTHVDGIVLARNLFHSSVNYRSVVLFGKAEKITDSVEKKEALKIISDNIIAGRSAEVPLGSEKEIETTLAIKFKIETASAKVRSDGPTGDEHEPNEIWSGVIPVAIKSGDPIPDLKFNKHFELSSSVKKYVEQGIPGGFVFTQLSPEELNKSKEELIAVATVAYSELFRKFLSEDNLGKYKETMKGKDMWDQLFSSSTCFVCKKENKIVGAAYLIPSGNAWRFFESDWTYIRMVGVQPEYEGKGIGKHLTRMCINLAKKRNEKTIALHTSEMQNAARHIYESMGFTVLKEIERIWDKKYWVYTLDLKYKNEEFTRDVPI